MTPQIEKNIWITVVHNKSLQISKISAKYFFLKNDLNMGTFVTEPTSDFIYAYHLCLQIQHKTEQSLRRTEISFPVSHFYEI